MARRRRKTPGIRPTRSGKWEARYTTIGGGSGGKTFERKGDAEDFRSTARS